MGLTTIHDHVLTSAGDRVGGLLVHIPPIASRLRGFGIISSGWALGDWRCLNCCDHQFAPPISASVWLVKTKEILGVHDAHVSESSVWLVKTKEILGVHDAHVSAGSVWFVKTTEILGVHDAHVSAGSVWLVKTEEILGVHDA